MKEYLILIHGYGNNTKSMENIHNHFMGKYKVLNLGYVTKNMTFTDLMTRFCHVMKNKIKRGAKVNFVVHSFGGIITRAIITKCPWINVGRVVMIGTPNSGTSLITHLKRQPLIDSFLDRISHTLETGSRQAKRYHIAHCDVGVIAGNKSFSFNHSTSYVSLIFYSRDIRHDGTVEVDQTKLSYMSDFIEINDNHADMINNKTVINYCENFLTKGRFIDKSWNRTRKGI